MTTELSCHPASMATELSCPTTPQWPKGLPILPGHCGCQHCPPHPGHSCGELFVQQMPPVPRGNIPEHTQAQGGPALGPAASPCVWCCVPCPTCSGTAPKEPKEPAGPGPEAPGSCAFPLICPFSLPCRDITAHPWGPHGGGESGQTHRNKGHGELRRAT